MVRVAESARGVKMIPSLGVETIQIKNLLDNTFRASVHRLIHGKIAIKISRYGFNSINNSTLPELRSPESRLRPF